MCNICGKSIRVVKGRNGKFWGCSGYPSCKATKKYTGSNSKQSLFSLQDKAQQYAKLNKISQKEAMELLLNKEKDYD